MKSAREPFGIEPHKDFSVNVDDGRPQLVGFRDHLLTGFFIFSYIMFLVGQLMTLQKLLSHFTVYAGGGGVNFNHRVIANNSK